VNYFTGIALPPRMKAQITKSVSMSARNGPEACVKCEIWLGKGWASSWEYIGADPPCLPFRYHLLLLDRGYAVRVVARTERDAIAMVDSVCGPGHVMTCQRTNNGPDSDILMKHKAKWREFLELQCGLSLKHKNQNATNVSTSQQHNNKRK
jgi:hypothetical protein